MSSFSMTRACIALTLLTVGTGCVKRSTHQAALNTLAAARAEQQQLQDDAQAQARQHQARLAAEADARKAVEAELARTNDQLARTEADRDRNNRLYEEARAETQRLEVTLSQSGSEYRLLEYRLEQLAAIEQEVRQRNAIYEEVIGKFKSLIDAGRLTVVIERGRMVIKLPQDILFESGSATLGADGRSTLAEVAGVLAEFEDRRFQVEGHTDNVPIATARFPSNWELSTARALSVVRLLVDSGVAPGNLSGAGYGEFQPVADNGEPAGRRLNRRIDIVMLPNLDIIAAAQVQGR